MEKLGIDSLKKMVDLGCELEHIGVQVIKNGKNIIADITELVSEIPTLAVQVPAAIAAFPQVPAEFKDLDTQEAAELVAYTVAKLAVDNVKAVAVINASFKLVLGMYFNGIELYNALHLPAQPAV